MDILKVNTFLSSVYHISEMFSIGDILKVNIFLKSYVSYIMQVNLPTYLGLPSILNISLYKLFILVYQFALGMWVMFLEELHELKVFI